MPGTHPPNILVRGRQREYPPPLLLRTFGYSRPILVAVRSLSLMSISFGYKTPPIRFSQAGGQSPFGGSSPQPWTRVHATAHQPENPPARPYGSADQSMKTPILVSLVLFIEWDDATESVVIKPSFSANPWPTAAFPFLLQDWLHRFPRLFTVTSPVHSVFYFLVFLFFLHFLVVGSVR